MSFSQAAMLALGVLAVALAVWLWRSRRIISRLEERLEASAHQLENLQVSFSRFAPEAVIERVIASGVQSRGEKKEVSVLFADLVGFTALSERVEPDVLVELLNGYFERMSDAISEHRGHVSTFIGDGILAFFGALEPNPWQANDAAHAALAMGQELEAYNRDLEARGLPRLKVGIGLHRGVGVAGLVGSRNLMEFAFVGRTVNVAARVQDLTRERDADMILTGAFHRELDPRFRLRALAPARARGVSEPIEIWALEGFSRERTA